MRTAPTKTVTRKPQPWSAVAEGGVEVVFSPGDHHGVWAMEREGIKGKGMLPEYALEIVERIAKEKALA